MGNIWVIFLKFQKILSVAKIISRIINTTTSIWLFSSLYLAIICCSKLAVFLKLCSWKTVCFSAQIMSVKQIIQASFDAEWSLLFIWSLKMTILKLTITLNQSPTFAMPYFYWKQTENKKNLYKLVTWKWLLQLWDWNKFLIKILRGTTKQCNDASWG